MTVGMIAALLLLSAAYATATDVAVQGLLVIEENNNMSASIRRGAATPHLFGPRSSIPLTNDALLFRTEFLSSDVHSTRSIKITPAWMSIGPNGSVTAAVDFGSPYDLYVVLRMKHNWEAYMSYTLMRDMERTARDMVSWELSHHPNVILVNGSLFAALMATEHRISHHRVCTSVSDECQQESQFSYTTSYNLLVPDSGQTGRLATVLRHVRGLFTIAVHSKLPEDAFTTIELIVVVVPSATSWYYELGIALLVALVTLIFTVVVLAAIKQRGLQAALVRPEQAGSWREELSQWGQHARAWIVERLRYRVRFSHIRSLSLWPLRRQSNGPAAPEDGGATRLSESESNPPPPLGAEEEDEGDVCRICHSKDPERDLFAPCRCNGSSRYVHRACLERWRATTTNPEHRVVCAECKAPFRLRLTRHSTALTDTVLRTVLRRVGIATAAITLCILSGSIVKALCYVVTWGDPNVVWSMFNMVHWVMGFAAILSFFITVAFLRYIVEDYPSHLTQRLPILIGLSLTMPIMWGYAAGRIVDLFCSNVTTGEVNFGLGVATQFFFLVYMSPRLLHLLEATIVTRQEVLDRDFHDEDSESPSPTPSLQDA